MAAALANGNRGKDARAWASASQFRFSLKYLSGEAKRLAALMCRSSTDADRMVGFSTWYPKRGAQEVRRQ
jgi:hypothetical protein